MDAESGDDDKDGLIGLSEWGVVKISRLTGCKISVGKREKFIFIDFVDRKPMKRFDDGNDMYGFRSLNNSASKRVLDPVKLTVWKVMIERITVVKFRMDDEGCNDAGCFEVKMWAHTSKFTDMTVAGFRKCTGLVREGKVFVKNKTKVASGVHGL